MLSFSHPVVSDSLQPRGLQHTRPPCPSPSPKVCPSSCSLHGWCHPAISSSDTLFSFCPQSFPPSGTFPMSSVRIRWPKHWSFSFSISPSSECLGLISLKSLILEPKKKKFVTLSTFSPSVCHAVMGADFSSVQFSCSVVSNSLQPMDCSMPDFSIPHHLLEFAQVRVHWMGDAIQ